MNNAIFVLRNNKTDSYVYHDLKKRPRTYTPFLEYAAWFESKEITEKHRIKREEWVDDGVRWWQKWENVEYLKHRIIN